MPVDFHSIWNQSPGAWDAALPEIWQVAHDAVTRAMTGENPAATKALAEDAVEEFRTRICGARTFKGLKKEINVAAWQEGLRNKALEVVALNRESIAAGDYWRLRPLKKGDPQAWVDVKEETDEAVRNACRKRISSHGQCNNWMPIWESCADEFIETITAEFKRNGMHRCYAWSEIKPGLHSLATFRIRDLLRRRTKQDISRSRQSSDEDYDVFWRMRDEAGQFHALPAPPDAESKFARQDLLELFKAAGVSRELAEACIEHTCDGTPAIELSQRLTPPIALATFYARLNDARESVIAFARDPDNQRRWRGTVTHDAAEDTTVCLDDAASQQSNLK